jgi:putative FmdB family regulatory protein
VPIYEYRCAKCGNVFEVLQKFSDAPLKKHEKCGGKVEKLISAPGIHFKGEGWYITDYARAGSKDGQAKESKSSESTGSESSSASSSSASSSSDSSSSDSSGASSKTETKSETKTETKAPSKSKKN